MQPATCIKRISRRARPGVRKANAKLNDFNMKEFATN